MEADHAYTDCMFHHLWNYAKKTVEPARTVVKAAHAACWFEHTHLESAMHKAQPRGGRTGSRSLTRRSSRTKRQSCWRHGRSKRPPWHGRHPGGFRAALLLFE
jgi:hypothetical protein